jgi:LuxR family maltose regulon positive regulatory protein
MRELEELVWRTETLSQVALVRSLKARLALLRGDVDTASRLLHGTRADSPRTTSIETVPLTRALWLLSLSTDESLRDAIHLADELECRGEDWQHQRIQVQAALVHSLAFDRQGRGEEAMLALRRALSLAQPGGLIRTFVDLGPPMQRLLTRLSVRGPAQDPYLDRLIRSFPGQNEPPSASPNRPRDEVQWSAEALTWRELEVLELLSERLSNKEIAEKLVVSPLTVKRHTIAIYRKLDVPGRREAVARASTLQLLSVGSGAGTNEKATLLSPQLRSLVRQTEELGTTVNELRKAVDAPPAYHSEDR